LSLLLFSVGAPTIVPCVAAGPQPRAYDTLGRGDDRHRRPDPVISGRILAALGDSASVLDVGAGTGSYEPRDRAVVAVEPSGVMIAQRAPDAAPVVRGVAEALPFRDAAFDATMALLRLLAPPRGVPRPGVRASISALARLEEAAVRPMVERLARDLRSGEWDRRYGDLRALEEIDLGYRLVVARRT
jgi:SAM-dependent methyltransferase